MVAWVRAGKHATSCRTSSMTGSGAAGMESRLTPRRCAASEASSLRRAAEQENAAHLPHMSTPTGARSASPVDAMPVLHLGRLCLDFGRIERLCKHPDGQRPETDTDHTVMVGVVGCAFAARHLPWLDLGLIAQYALVHDLVEVYAGDTPTLRIDDGIRRRKAEIEAAALDRLRRELGLRLPWLTDTIDAYEQKARPEARYVKALDKLLPKITHIANGAAVLHEQGMVGAELAVRYDDQLTELMGYADDFPPLFELRTQLLGLLADVLAPNRPADGAAA